MKFYAGLLKERIGYDFYCDIAERVVEARKKVGLTQKELAEKSGLSASRLQAIENVKIRTTLKDIEILAKALAATPDWLIEAEPSCHGKDCYFLIWNEKYDDYKLYEKASSARMAFLKLDQRLRIERKFQWVEPRDRAIVELVGVPLTEADLSARFRKLDSPDEDAPIEPN